jgi:hypothetical protein
VCCTATTDTKDGTISSIVEELYAPDYSKRYAETPAFINMLIYQGFPSGLALEKGLPLNKIVWNSLHDKAVLG